MRAKFVLFYHSFFSERLLFDIPVFFIVLLVIISHLLEKLFEADVPSF
jgi:hypothetical protein